MGLYLAIGTAARKLKPCFSRFFTIRELHIGVLPTLRGLMDVQKTFRALQSSRVGGELPAVPFVALH